MCYILYYVNFIESQGIQQVLELSYNRIYFYTDWVLWVNGRKPFLLLVDVSSCNVLKIAVITWFKLEGAVTEIENILQGLFQELALGGMIWLGAGGIAFDEFWCISEVFCLKDSFRPGNVFETFRKAINIIPRSEFWREVITLK